MDTPISWIKAYVPDLDCTPQEYADKMTLSGSNMESVTYLDKNLEKIKKCDLFLGLINPKLSNLNIDVENIYLKEI